MAAKRIIDEIYELFGSDMSALAHAAGVSRQAAYRWFAPDMGFVPNREPAIRLATKLLEMGKPISSARLMALPDLTDNGGGRGHRKPSRTRNAPICCEPNSLTAVPAQATVTRLVGSARAHG